MVIHYSITEVSLSKNKNKKYLLEEMLIHIAIKYNKHLH